MVDRTDIDRERVRSQLMKRRGELLERESATKEARDPVELDQARLGRLSRMDALQSQALAQDVERRRKIELQRIDAALGRIEAGEYGYCLNCGEAIPIARLEFDPAVATCVDCAR
ncbi:MAG: TraR/DksA family transcriptional regulator [Alphaproteobacteria bacterium]|nr:TraR/DksA family transcriptional regulator [Alphaproteobacteria bacterium]